MDISLHNLFQYFIFAYERIETMDDASGDAARSYVFLHYVLFFIYLLFTGKYRYSLPSAGMQAIPVCLFSEETEVLHDTAIRTHSEKLWNKNRSEGLYLFL